MVVNGGFCKWRNCVQIQQGRSSACLVGICFVIGQAASFNANENVASIGNSNCSFGPPERYVGYTSGPNFTIACLGNAKSGYTELITGASPKSGYHQAGSMSIDKCKKRCNEKSRCKGIIIESNDQKVGLCRFMDRQYQRNFISCKTTNYCEAGSKFVANKVKWPHWYGPLEAAKANCLADADCTGVWDHGDDGDNLVTSHTNPWRYCKEKPRSTNDIVNHDVWIPKICPDTDHDHRNTTMDNCNMSDPLVVVEPAGSGSLCRSNLPWRFEFQGKQSGMLAQGLRPVHANGFVPPMSSGRAELVVTLERNAVNIAFATSSNLPLSLEIDHGVLEDQCGRANSAFRCALPNSSGVASWSQGGVGVS